MPDNIWLPCPFCGCEAVELPRWKDHRGCADTECPAHLAGLSIEQWNRRRSSASSKQSCESDYRLKLTASLRVVDMLLKLAVVGESKALIDAHQRLNKIITELMEE